MSGMADSRLTASPSPAPPIRDEFALEVVRGRLQAVVDEAGATIIRTAFSVVITDAKDFACGLLTPDCTTVVQSRQSIPVFLATMSQTARHLVNRFPISEWRPDDVFATNDPWLGTGHLYDLTLLRPIFIGGEVIALAAVVGHLPDIGGRIVGTDATQIFEEGLRIPPVKLVSAGVVDSTIVEILTANVRMPDQVLGDLRALLNAGAVLDRRLRGIVEGIGIPAFQGATQELDRRVEVAFRRRIESVPDGEYQASIASEGAKGIPFEIRLRLVVTGDSIAADFGGSSPQVPAGINSCFNYTSSYVVAALKSVLIPRLPFNHGVLRPITVTAPEGSIVNSRYPAPGAARSLVGHYIPGLVIRALSDALPDETTADAGAPRPSIRISGIDSGSGEMFTAPIYAPGGFGARSSADGPSTTSFPTNASTIPVELIELQAPIMVEQKELIPDSGGSGRFRGGLGQRIIIRALQDNLSASVVAQRVQPRGVHGGGDGTPARVLLNDEPVTDPSVRLKLNRGDRITLESPGGGGFGDPLQRSGELATEDRIDGYVTRAER